MQEFTGLNGEKIPVALFLGEEDGKLSKKGESVLTTARVIWQSVGPSGENIVYFENLIKGLELKKLPIDKYLKDLKRSIDNLKPCK